MKRTLIISTLAVLLVLPLIITGCSCGGGATLTDSDIATIRGFPARLDAHDQAIASINTTLSGLDTDTLDKLADLDADELAALLDLDLNTALADITTLKTDMSTLKGTTIPGLDTRLTELENGGGGGSSGGGSSTSGEVTVVLDVEATPLQFSSGTTPVSQVLPIKITNGTNKYQKVIFGIALHCVSSDYKADVVQDSVDASDTIDFSMTVNSVAMSANPMPATLIITPCGSDCETTGDDATAVYKDCQYIYFLWAASDSVLVAPGKETTVYAILNNFTTAISYELWEVMLSGITVTPL